MDGHYANAMLDQSADLCADLHRQNKLRIKAFEERIGRAHKDKRIDIITDNVPF
jgi:hypothetical protein